MSKCNNGCIAYASIPHKNELRCIIYEIDFTKIRDFPMKSSYHWQILKCRTIIQSIEEVIASPILGSTGLIYVIAAEKLIENNKLNAQLQDIDVICRKSQEITDDIYAMCLNYTIQCKIAPLWNKVGCYYVHGLQFIASMEMFSALKIQITINDEHAQFHFYATKIKIPFIQLEDLHLLNSLIAEFLANNDDIINLNKHYISVYVLPSMKKGRAVSVFKKIPSYFQFKSYNQLRKYWIDMYGYYLPETEEGIIYYEIKFLSGSNSFIYPSVCIAIEPIQCCSFTNADNIISQFINDTCNTLSKICNKQLHIYDNNRQHNCQAELSGINTRKMNTENHDHLSLPRKEELNLNNVVEKDSDHGSDYPFGHGCDTSQYFCKSKKSLTKKRSLGDLIIPLETCSKLMKFDKSRESSV